MKMEKAWIGELDRVLLEYTDWPEWFYLDFLPATGTAVPPHLLLGIAENAMDPLLAYLVSDRFRGDLEEEFLLDTDKPWGYGGVLEPHAEGSGFKEFVIAIPQMEKDAGVCNLCRGKKKDRYGDECTHCFGTGRDIVLDWDHVDRIAATLSILSEVILDKPDKKLIDHIDTKRKQLLSVCLGFGGKTSPRIGAMLATPFGDYLRSISQQELPEVEVAIESSYLRMLPSNARFGESGFFMPAVHSNGQLIIDAKGASLYVDGFDDSLKKESGPMELDCKNVDGTHQQITLLCGLAALSGMARKQLYPEPP